MSQQDTLDITISCFCGEHQHTYEVPTSIKVLEFIICHCNSCRRSSGGSLYHGAIDWEYPLKAVSEASIAPVDPKSLLRQYFFGPSLDFWFCEICSTKMYWQYKKPGSILEIFSGLIPASLLRTGGMRIFCRKQVHVDDTLDEGFSQSFRSSEGHLAPIRYDGDCKTLHTAEDSVGQQFHFRDTVEAACHCGSVELKIARQRDQYFPIEIDVSEESRSLNSVDLSVWALVNRSSIVSVNDMPLHILEKLVDAAQDDTAGPVRVYQKSSRKPKVFFCNKCSSSIFLQSVAGAENDIIRVGAGILQSQSGARAEDFLDWSSVEPLELKSRGIALDPRNLRSSSSSI